MDLIEAEFKGASGHVLNSERLKLGKGTEAGRR